MLKFSEIFEFSKEKFRKIPILKEFEWFEWFEWFGPSPIEPFNSGSYRCASFLMRSSGGSSGLVARLSGARKLTSPCPLSASISTAAYPTLEKCIFEKCIFQKCIFRKMHFSKILQIFGGLVLGCIKTNFCKKICVRQHFSSSTRFASFCTAAISKFSQKIGLKKQQFS